MPLQWVLRNSTRVVLEESGSATRHAICKHYAAALGGHLDESTIAGIVERNPRADCHVLQRLVRASLPQLACRRRLNTVHITPLENWTPHSA
jgi:hypothetical protein